MSKRPNKKNSGRALPSLLETALRSRVAAAPGTVFGIEKFPAITGAYCLALHLPKPVSIVLPRRLQETIDPGWFLYFGSAYGPGGLRARLARHFRHDKSVRWHIDQLTMAADHLAALAVPGGNECALRAEFADNLPTTVPLAGFGSSDCRKCPSHLLRWSVE
ncbi:MAG: GIY-YIG nuclease family protein [Hyphomicrobiales bacterium]|nr:GIY-YIG nuclease family protein [Hyphomicrobiales bacterium]